MTRPGLAVYVGFDATWQTPEASIVWTELTGRLMDRRSPIETTRGATAANDEPDTGSIDLVLRNSDRHLDTHHSTGPFFGKLKAGVPMKVEAHISDVADGDLTWDVDELTWDGDPLIWASSSFPVARGTIKAWPQRYDRGNQVAVVPIEAFDGFDKLARARTERSVLETEVLADGPVAYWKLDERSGGVMVDSSGNGRNGIYDNAVLGEAPLVLDDTGASLRCEHVGDNRGQYKGGDLPTAPPVSIEAWVKFERNLTETHMIVCCQRDNALGSALLLKVDTSIESPNGELVLHFYGLGGYRIRGHTRVDDGEPHHVVATIASTAASDITLYVDGVKQTQTVVAGTAGATWGGHHLWCVGNVAAASSFDFGIGGWVDEVAIYDTVLTPARIEAHYDAGATAFSGQRSDLRTAWVLDQIGWPADRRDLEPGRSLLGPATFTSSDKALGYLRLIAQTEDAPIFMTAEDKVRSLDRYWRYLDPAATVAQLTLTDDGTGIGVATFELDPEDDELLVNAARFTRRGGAQQIDVDETSRGSYGEAELQRTDLLHQTDAETLGLAQWTTATRSEPVPRVRSALIRLHKAATDDQRALLGLDLGHRITCSRTPQGVGSAFSIDCVVAGIRHEITAVEWLMELYLAPAPDNTVELFTLGTSQLGGTHILAH